MTGQLAALRKWFLDLWLVCERSSVVLANPKSLFPQRKSRGRPPDRAYADLCASVTIGAATGNTEAEEVMNEFERRDEACLSTPT
jgi:hypothetical protein